MERWERLADDTVIKETVTALKANGVEAFIVESGEEAKRKVFEILPEGAEVMAMSSTTLDKIGISKDIESSKINSVRKKLMDPATQGAEKRKLGAAPEWTIGSVHAVTRDGHVLIASNTGSQLPAYAYGAGNVIWVVGAQKIVKNTEEGIKRIYEHSLPLEIERAKKVYGITSAVNKLLIVNKENIQGRITMILVKEKLGF